MNESQCNVVLLLFCLDDYDDLLDYKEKYSTLEERREAEKYAFPENNYKLLSYILRRYVVSQYLKCLPLEINYCYNDFGKPYPDNSNLDFNVSRSGKWFLMGLTKNKFIGVDIEVIKEIPKLDSFINKYASQKQKKSLLKMEGYDKLVMTYIDWCMKESFMKARGFGIKEEFKRFTYILENPEIGVDSEDYKKIFTWSFDNKYLTNATSNMHLYSYDEDLALAITTVQDNRQVMANTPESNIIYYKANPSLKPEDLIHL